MKFIVYLLTFRWVLDGYRKLRYSNDALELLKFEDASPTLVHIRLPYSVSRRRMINALKNLRGSFKANPLNLDLGFGDWSLSTSENIIDHMIESRNGCIVAFPKNQVPEEVLRGEGWYDFGIFMGSVDSWRTDIAELDNLLLRAWFIVKQRRGDANSHCDNCGIPLELTSEITCMNCSRDIEMPSGLPSKNIKIYEEILEYEKATGKEVLPRCS